MQKTYDRDNLACDDENLLIIIDVSFYFCVKLIAVNQLEQKVNPAFVLKRIYELDYKGMADNFKYE